MSKPVFTLEAFRDFALSKPPTESYNYHDINNCACAQYCKFLGVEYGDPVVSRAVIHSGLEYAASCANTWGELVSKLEKAMLDRSPFETHKPVSIFRSLWAQAQRD